MTDVRIPRRYQAPCELCAELLDVRADGVHQWIAGWVMNRRAGGAHAVRCAVPSLRWAHRLCVDRLAAGKIEQGTLL